MVGPEPGLTRDPIQASFDHEGTVFDLVDTPGWMKRTTYTSYDESQGWQCHDTTLPDCSAGSLFIMVLIAVLFWC